MPERTIEASYLERFKAWFVFAFFFCCIAIASSILNTAIDRRGFPDQHWLTGKTRLSEFVAMRIAFLIVIPAVCASLAALSRRTPPAFCRNRE